MYPLSLIHIFVTIYDAEFFDGVGGRTVLPVGAHVLVGIDVYKRQLYDTALKA